MIQAVVKMFFKKKNKVQSADEIYEVIKKTYIQNNYECQFDDANKMVIANFKGDDLPIGTAISISEETMTLYVHCRLMFEVPEHGVDMILKEFNNLNNMIAAGSFFLETDTKAPMFRLVHFYDLAPVTPDVISKLLGIAVGVTDLHDGRLKEMIPEEWKVAPADVDLMMYR